MSAETSLYISREMARQFILNRVYRMSDCVLEKVVSALVQGQLVCPVISVAGEDDEEFKRRCHG